MIVRWSVFDWIRGRAVRRGPNGSFVLTQRGTYVIRTTGMPGGYLPPSASLHPGKTTR